MHSGETGPTVRRMGATSTRCREGFDCPEGASGLGWYPWMVGKWPENWVDHEQDHLPESCTIIQAREGVQPSEGNDTISGWCVWGLEGKPWGSLWSPGVTSGRWQ